MPYLKHLGLTYVVETSQLVERKPFTKSLHARIITLSALQREHLRPDGTVIIDVDLRNVATVTKLKGVLGERGTGCRIFLVDPHIRVADHARMLGADAILSPKCDRDAIKGAVRSFYKFSEDPAITSSIESGIAALEGGFKSLLRDEAFDTAGMENASGQILDAIDSAGVDEWLATVRGYHVGTFQHCMLVTATASSFARKLGLGRADVVKITAAALVHDIGKAAIPLHILDKPGALSPEELAVMRQHPAIGHNYLARKSQIAAEALRSVRWHHEYLDGSGYPDGLCGSDIDDITRIITISDVYAALIERRAYKAPKSKSEAFGILEAMAAEGKLETALVRAFGRVVVKKQAA